MPIIYREEYGVKPRSDGQPGYVEVVPTTQKFQEADGSDVRLDRVYVYGCNGVERTYLQDKMGARFTDNQPGTDDDRGYLITLQSKEKR